MLIFEVCYYIRLIRLILSPSCQILMLYIDLWDILPWSYAAGNWKLWLLFTQTNRKPPHRQVHSIFLYFTVFSFSFSFCWHIFSTHGTIHGVQHPLHQACLWELQEPDYIHHLSSCLCSPCLSYEELDIPNPHFLLHTPPFVLLKLPSSARYTVKSGNFQ